MDRVLIDNWKMEEITANMFDFSTSATSKEYNELLSALLLWDEIYYLENKFSTYWKSTNLFDLISPVVIPYNDEENMYDSEAEILYQRFYESEWTGEVAIGAIKYLLFSDMLGCDYLASQKRTKFIKKYNPVETIGEKRILRTEYGKFLDKSLIECFEDLNTIFGSNVFEIKKPVMTDFILQNTPKGMTYIEFAMILRNEKPIVEYRNYLKKMENDLNACNWDCLFKLKYQTEELVRNIVRADEKNIYNIAGSISISPSINISKDIKLKKKNVQLAFFEDLARFAFRGRKLDS